MSYKELNRKQEYRVTKQSKREVTDEFSEEKKIMHLRKFRAKLKPYSRRKNICGVRNDQKILLLS